MRARVIEVIEVSVGDARRYFLRDGTSIGIVSDVDYDALPQPGTPAEVAQDARPVSAEEVIASVPKRSAARVEELRGAMMRRWGDGPAAPWTPPPFDPREGPRLEAEKLARGEDVQR